MAGMYGALGGRRAFAAAVEDFYRRVVGDPRLRPYFDATDLKRLKAHQHSFLAMALGGPRAYLGRTMAVAHSGLAITDEAFDRVMDHLVSTLADLGVPASLIREVGTKLLPLRHDIVRVPGSEHGRVRPPAPAAAGHGEAEWPEPPHRTPPRPGPLPRPARPAAASGGSMFEPDPENPGHADHADYAGHAEPVSRPRPAWR